MTFPECVLHCSRVPELVAEFDRLNDTHLSTVGRRSVLNG